MIHNGNPSICILQLFSKIHTHVASSGIMMNTRLRLPAGPSFILGCWITRIHFNERSQWVYRITWTENGFSPLIAINLITFSLSLYPPLVLFLSVLHCSYLSPISSFLLISRIKAGSFCANSTCTCWAYGHLSFYFGGSSSTQIH